MSQVFFEARDSDGDQTLWTSDGTTTGTFELGGLANAGVKDADSGGLTTDSYAMEALGGELLFMSGDAKDYSATLWTSNATAAGTVELGGVGNQGVPGAGITGLAFFDSAVIGNQVLFSGFDPEFGGYGLWVTNGTAGGTVEIGGAGNSGVAGIDPQHAIWEYGVTSIGTKGLFETTDATNAETLWVSDGTVKGTFEIGGYDNAGVANSPSGGLQADGRTLFSLGGKAVFGAQDSAGDYGLWVSDGTLAGTFEIGGLSNKGLSGDVGNLGISVYTTSASAYGGLLYFEDGSGDLWETNGVASGTFEIGGKGGAGIANHLGALQPYKLTTFIGGVIFDASDLSSSNLYGATPGVWVSDGTATGTVELGGAGNAGISGVENGGLQIAASVAFGNEVLFTADDSLGAAGLWVTNGTQAGTFELGGLRDSGVAGASALGLHAVQLTVSGGQVFFQGENSADKLVLWVTDGTTAGTQEIVTAAGPANADYPATPDDFVSTAPAGAIYNNGGQTLTNSTLTSKYVYLNHTGSVWDTVTVSNDTFYVDAANASVIGGGDTFIFSTVYNSVSLYSTGGNWDTVDGSNQIVDLTSAQASILGGGDTVYATSGSWLSLYQTNGAWDTVYGSNENVILTSAQASVFGGADTVYATGFSSISLGQTGNNWDTVEGGYEYITVTNAYASVLGGADVIYDNGKSWISLYQTAAAWDTVYATGENVSLTGAQANVFGGADVIYAGAGSSVSLFQTAGQWDAVEGSGETVYLNSAQATVIGNSAAVVLAGYNSFTLSGTSEHLVTSKALGQDWISGFGSTDSIQFSAADVANFAALQKHMSQPGADTVITLDSSDQITLYGVQKAALVASQFTFV